MCKYSLKLIVPVPLTSGGFGNKASSQALQLLNALPRDKPLKKNLKTPTVDFLMS